MASLLGNFLYAGLATLLTTQANLGAVNQAANLYSINTGASASLAPADFAMFQPSFLAQGVGALGAGVGFGAATLHPVLFTRTGATTVWFNPNTTAVPGDILTGYLHSQIR